MDKAKQEKVERKCFWHHKSGQLTKNCYKKSSYGKRPEGNVFMCSEEVQSKDVCLVDSVAAAHMIPYTISYNTLLYEIFLSLKQMEIGNNGPQLMR